MHEFETYKFHNSVSSMNKFFTAAKRDTNIINNICKLLRLDMIIALNEVNESLIESS